MDLKINSKIANKIYDDVFHPAAVQMGEAIARIPRAINAALSPLDQWILHRNFNLEQTKRILEEKLSSINPDEIVSPPPYIAIPALESISYCMNSKELFDLYSNLLSKALYINTQNTVHPAFIEIIKQLSPVDALLLREFAHRNHIIPAAKLSILSKRTGVHIVGQPQEESFSLELISDIHLSGFSEQILRSSVDNLKRLGLIALQDICLNEPNAYNFVQNSELYHSLFSEHIASADKCIQTHKKILSTTSFGLTFCDVCIFGIE